MKTPPLNSARTQGPVVTLDARTQRKLNEELLIACRTDDTQRVLELIGQGAQAKQSSTLGRNILHWAVNSGPLAIVEALIFHGADVNELNKGKETPLHWATHVSENHKLMALLNAGATVDARDESGTTPLMWAAEAGRLNAMLSLLEHGADPNLKDANGNTPLGWGSKQGGEKVLLVLIAHGADSSEIDAKTSTLSGLPPLHAAAIGGLTRRLMHLLDNGENPDALHMGARADEHARRADQDETLAAWGAWHARQAVDAAMSSMGSVRTSERCKHSDRLLVGGRNRGP